jgi:hypothetical protein
MRPVPSIMAALAVLLVNAQPSFAKPDFRGTLNIQHRSAELSRSYLRTWSTRKGAAVSEVQRVYAPRVRFYGRLLSRQELAREKTRFVHRWPIRSYAHRPGTMRFSCSVARRQCTVRSLIDWRTANPKRRAVAAGASRFEQAMEFARRSPRPLVFYENGSVVSKRKPTRRAG